MGESTDERTGFDLPHETKGFFWLAGQGGFGVQTSPGLGALAAEVILGKQQPEQKIDVARFVV